MLDWIKQKCIYGWKPGAIKTVVLEGELHEVPVLNHTDNPWKLWAKQKQE
jgi:hypothetical protein